MMTDMHNDSEWDNLMPLTNHHGSLETPMSDIERSELVEYEQVIEAGLQTFYEVGTALLAIRDKRLYRQEYKTFEDYCKVRWGFSDRRARQLMSAAETMNNLKTEEALPVLPQSSIQAEELAKLKSPDQQREAWHRAIDTAPEKNGRIQLSGAHVQRVVDDMLGIERKKVEPNPPLIDTETGEIFPDGSDFNYKRDTKSNRLGLVYEPQGYDACQTPPYAIDPLLPYLERSLRIWEPAVGDGHLVEAFYDSGFDQCVVSDMLTGQNFLEYQPDEPWDCIITNPPYSLKYDFLERCYELCKPFALLVPVELLGSGKAQSLMALYGFEIMLLSRRIDFKMPNAGWSGAGAQFPTFWLCWKLLPEPVMFGDIPLEVKKAFHQDAK